MTDSFDLDTRKKIYRLIEKNPGLNLSTIAEMLHMNVPLVDYHTRYFEKHELITVVKEERFKRYYIKGAVGVTEQNLFEALRRDIPLKIVLYLLKNPYAKHYDIFPALGISKSTLSYHLKKLVHKGIVKVHVQGEDWTYVIINEKEVVRFLLHYRPSRVLKRFTDAWDELDLL